ncbi:hypothetical protein DPEC_G00048090 [Dallia pectoralis]|uniref:Uncharacterized protein n=1 Tax=Dallia pectoralis TaxID=75939 RepID=A0ACC2HAE1_DALPE|nr:hypothetical protein DPEC_G00048090 [Dallia pectoralis]
MRLRYDGIYYLEIIEIKSYDGGDIKVLAENPEGIAEHMVKLEITQKEDFRSVLRRAPEPKVPEPSAAAEHGKVSFDVVKVDKPTETKDTKEVVQLKKTERVIHSKATEETDELKGKFKRRTEEGYYEAITAVELKSQRRMSLMRTCSGRGRKNCFTIRKYCLRLRRKKRRNGCKFISP